jgi:hypothetical protein
MKPGRDSMRSVGNRRPLLRTDGARITHSEVFDVADADRALGPFAELCAHPAPEPTA